VTARNAGVGFYSKGVMTWLMESGEEYFGKHVVLKKGDEKCFSNNR
jgi:hypothetical protein